MCTILLLQALLYCCEDNATAVVIPFGSWGKGDTSTSMFYRDVCMIIRLNPCLELQWGVGCGKRALHFYVLLNLLVFNLLLEFVSRT